MRVTTWLSGLLLAAWVLLEFVLRRGDEARNWQGGEEDRSSTRLVVVTYVIAFVAPFLLDTSGVGVTIANSVLAWIGIAVGVVGLAIRIWAMPFSVRITPAPCELETLRSLLSVARTVVRHPGYIGSILVWVGSRLAVNWLVASATALALLLVYTYRISAEERMLVDHFGDAYRAYKTRTWRLVPYVW